MFPRVTLLVAYATGRASHARQVKGDDPDEKGYPGPTGWRLGVRPTTSPHKNNCYEKKNHRRPRPTQGCRADDYGYDYVNSVYSVLGIVYYC